MAEQYATDDHGNRRDTCGWCVQVPTTTGWARATQAGCPEHGSQPRTASRRTVAETSDRTITAAEDEVHELRRAVAEVRALHFQYRGVGSPPDSCAHCNQLAGYEVPWPCPTIQALDRAATHQDVGPPRYFDGGVQRTTFTDLQAAQGTTGLVDPAELAVDGLTDAERKAFIDKSDGVE